MTTTHPPGPRGNLILGNLFDMIRRPIPFMRELAGYGDLAHFRLGPLHAYLAASPEYVHEVLVKQAEYFHRDALSKRSASKFIGESLALLDGERHLRERKMMQPGFHAKKLEGYVSVMIDQARAMVDCWRNRLVIELYEEMQAVTLKVTCKTLLGADLLTSQLSEATQAMRDLEAVIAVEAREALPVPDWLPITRKRRMRRSIRTLKTLIERIIRERRASGRLGDDLLGMLLSATDETGSGLDAKRVYDEAVFLFVAGHETTAGTLTWALYLLERHPEIEAEVRRELDEVLGGRPPAFADLPRLQYLEKVIKETLRLYPGAWVFGRSPLKDTRLGPHTIRKGGIVFLCPFVTQRDRRYFDDPERFRPERFTADFEKSLPRFAYFPFGAGSHACLGQHFAMAEAKVVIASALGRYRLHAVTPEEVEPAGLALLQTARPVRMRLTERMPQGESPLTPSPAAPP